MKAEDRRGRPEGPPEFCFKKMKKNILKEAGRFEM